MNIEVLYVEDNPSDIELFKVVAESSTRNISLTTTDNLLDIENYLNEGIDVIVSDFNLRGFDGLDVLAKVKEVSPETPFIFFSSELGEEKAVNLIRNGATDFVLKENIGKMPVAIERALNEMKLQEEKKCFQNELVEKNELLGTLFNSLTDLIMLKNKEGKITKINNAFCKYFKTTPANVINNTEENFLKSKESEIADEHVLQRNQFYNYELKYINEEGKHKILEIIKSPLHFNNQVEGVVSVIRDITVKRLLEEQNSKDQYILKQAENHTKSGSFEFDRENDVLSVSSNFIKLLNLNSDRNIISSKKLINCIHPEDQPMFKEKFNQASDKLVDFELEHRYIPMGYKNGFKYCKTILKSYPNLNGSIMYGTIVETTESRETSLALLSIQEKERNKISRELHDNVGPKLSAISMFLNTEQRNEEKIQMLLTDSIKDIRSLSRMLTTSILENQTFSVALHFLIENSPGAEIIYLAEDFKDDSISEFVGGQLYRIMQEALNNILKYACPSKIDLEILEKRHTLIVNIVDDGNGFDKEAMKIGNGIRNMRERVRNCNGEFQIDSALKKGTKINIQIPIHNA